MEELFSFDDTLFSEKKKETSSDSQFEAHYQDPFWFLEIDVDNLPLYVDKLSLLKHKADYFYFKNELHKAISFYEEMLAILPENNVVTRRECYENLARCCCKVGTHNKSLRYSHLLHSTSKTVEHLTVSLTCLMDTHASCAANSGALLSCIKLIAIHKLNSHLWLRLAHILTVVLKVEVPGLASIVKFQPQGSQRCYRCDDDFCVAGIPESFFSGLDSGKESVLVLFCLMMSKYIMTGVRGTSVGFAAAVLLNNIEKIEDEISRLVASCAVSEASLSRLDCIVTKNVFGYDRNQVESSEENSGFVDRGSSKFKGDVLDVSFSSVSSFSFEDFQCEWFDDVLSNV